MEIFRATTQALVRSFIACAALAATPAWAIRPFITDDARVVDGGKAQIESWFRVARTGAKALSPRSRVILVYAMCGFANVASLGILVGSLTTLVPERRAEVLSLGWWSLFAGNVATGLSGAVVGLF